MPRGHLTNKNSNLDLVSSKDRVSQKEYSRMEKRYFLLLSTFSNFLWLTLSEGFHEVNGTKISTWKELHGLQIYSLRVLVKLKRFEKTEKENSEKSRKRDTRDILGTATRFSPSREEKSIERANEATAGPEIDFEGPGRNGCSCWCLFPACNLPPEVRPPLLRHLLVRKRRQSPQRSFATTHTSGACPKSASKRRTPIESNEIDSETPPSRSLAHQSRFSLHSLFKSGMLWQWWKGEFFIDRLDKLVQGRVSLPSW